MSDSTPPRDEPEETAEPGVLGNLPRRRPGVRTQRREEAAAQAESRRTAAHRDEDDRAERSTSTTGPAPGGIDDLARTGAAVAAEAAAIGLRLAGRALGAIRGAAERR